MNQNAPLTQGTPDGSRLTGGPLTFTFDGKRYTGFLGDSASSALWRAGVRLFNRSIKYRRLRGFLALGPEDPNALLTVGEYPAWIPNVPASQVLITEGMVLRSQNRWPTLRWDLASMLLGPGASLWGAGFYYKTFIWPSWKTYEGLIRKLAGLGYAPAGSDLPNPKVEHPVADVVIAGGGPAGLAIARGVARSGARVILCEREPVLGGELEFEAAVIEGKPAPRWVQTTRDELSDLGVRVLTQTTVISANNGITIAHGQPAGLPGSDTLYRIHAPLFINAMGAVERSIAFINNDRPGVILSGAADRLLSRYGVLAGQRPVLFGNHDRLYDTARRLLQAGAQIQAIVDTRTDSQSPVRAELQGRGINCLSGFTVLRAQGHPRIKAVTVAHLNNPRSTQTIATDALLVSGGWSPAVYAGLQNGGVPRYSEPVAAFVAEGQPDWRLCAGAAAGHLALDDVLVDAQVTVDESVRRLNRTTASGSPWLVQQADAVPQLIAFWRSPASRHEEKQQFVDLQNDVTVADLRQALQEGFVDIEHIKRYTTLGVGTEQGRTGGTLGAAIIAELRTEPLAEVGISRSRGPFQPTPLMVISGTRLGFGLRPARLTALDQAHQQHAAEMELMSGWMRPRYYRGNGQDPFAASVVEATRVRATGGICDASTLGKIEIAGPDAAAFLDGLYLTPGSTLKIGRSRYAALLREDGIVLDDGLLLRLSSDRFVATTSTSHTAHVLAHLEFYKDTQWANQRISVTDVSEAWSVIVVAGPQSRQALVSTLGTSWQETLKDLTHMGHQSGTWRDYPLRLLRASFTGELAYELHCAPAIASSLWSELVAAGLAPFGLEALDVLRVEKGYLTSSELNGQTAPADVFASSMLKAMGQPVGKAMLNRPAFSDDNRPVLVGVRACDGKSAFLGGAQITRPESPAHSLGYVTSSVFSPQLKEWIGLALVARNQASLGTELLARDPIRGGDTPVRITGSVHFDPSHERIRV